MTAAATENKWPDNTLTIESMDMEAQGVAHRPDGKVVFVDGALPFEVVRANVHRKKDNWKKLRCSKSYMPHPNVSRPDAPISVCMQAPAVAARCSTWMLQRKWPSSNAP